MKYRNIETGVILEPFSETAEATLENDPRYTKVEEDKPSRKPKSAAKMEE